MSAINIMFLSSGDTEHQVEVALSFLRVPVNNRQSSLS